MKGLHSKQKKEEDWKCGYMLILQAVGTGQRVRTETLLDQDMSMSLFMRGVPSFTSLNCKPKFHYKALKVSILVSIMR